MSMLIFMTFPNSERYSKYNRDIQLTYGNSYRMNYGWEQEQLELVMQIKIDTKYFHMYSNKNITKCYNEEEKLWFNHAVVTVV